MTLSRICFDGTPYTYIERGLGKTLPIAMRVTISPLESKPFSNRNECDESFMKNVHQIRDSTMEGVILHIIHSTIH